MSAIQCIWDAQAELGEGVFWHQQEQAVFWLDIIKSNLHRLSSDGNKHSWHFPGKISSAVPCSAGGLLATFQSGICHVNLESSTVSLVIPLESELPDNRFNDGCSDSRGQYWFGSMDDLQTRDSGAFYRLTPEGAVERQEHFGNMCITNGPTFSSGGETLFFTDTLGKKIYTASIDDNGRARSPELHIDFESQPGFPDGMCTDTDGGLWVCQFGGSRITRFVEGREDSILELPVPNITKCAFGGSDMRTLYITTAREGMNEARRQQFPLSGGLFATTLPYQGTAMTAVSLPATGPNQ